MANKSEDTASKALLKIEELAAAEKTPAYILAGMKAANGWGSGKEVSKTDYEKAQKAFLSGSMTGGKKNG